MFRLKSLRLKALYWHKDNDGVRSDLHTLHGLHPVVRLLAHNSPSLQAAAAFVLGTAASNNNKFQEQLMHLHPESISLLLQVWSQILVCVWMTSQHFSLMTFCSSSRIQSCLLNWFCSHWIGYRRIGLGVRKGRLDTGHSPAMHPDVALVQPLICRVFYSS